MSRKSEVTTTSAPKRGFFTNIRNKIFLGVLFAMPIMATLWIFKFLVDLSTSWFNTEKLAERFPFLGDLNQYLVEVMVILTVLLFFYLLGAMSNYFLGKKIYELIDKVLSAIPLVKNIYHFIRQICDWVARSQDNMFESVVLVEFPQKGSYSIAFVTSKTKPLLCRHIRDEAGNPLPCMNVFMPTTPNPTTGYLMIIPERDLVRVDISVSDAINLIISAGVVLPDKPGKSGNPIVQALDHVTNIQVDSAADGRKKP